MLYVLDLAGGQSLQEGPALPAERRPGAEAEVGEKGKAMPGLEGGAPGFPTAGPEASDQTEAQGQGEGEEEEEARDVALIRQPYGQGPENQGGETRRQEHGGQGLPAKSAGPARSRGEEAESGEEGQEAKGQIEAEAHPLAVEVLEEQFGTQEKEA